MTCHGQQRSCKIAKSTFIKIRNKIDKLKEQNLEMQLSLLLLSWSSKRVSQSHSVDYTVIDKLNIF